MIKDANKFLTHQDAATLNRNMVLKYIRNNAPVSRTDIWQDIGLSRASVTQIIKQLIEQKFVYEKGSGESTGGRKPCYLEFNANIKHILVFDWHLNTIYLVNLGNEILYSNSIDTDKTDDPNEFIEKICIEVNEIKSKKNIGAESIIGFGMVMPGMIDPVSGTVLLSLEQQWKNVNLKEMAQNRLGIPVTIETDNNMLALGEYICGLGQKVKDFVLIDVEDGCMGSSYILNGQLQRGGNNMSGEIGHISCNHDGPKCSCGKNGCFEAYIRSAMKRKEQNWMSEVAHYISMITSILINILDPKIVVFSGRILGKSINEFINEIEQEIIQQLLSPEKRDIQIKSSTLGESARLKGICEIVFDNNYSTI